MRPRTTLADILFACAIGAALALVLFYELGAS